MASSPSILEPAFTVNNQSTSPPLLQPQQQPNTKTKPDVTILNPPAYAARKGLSQIIDILISGTPFIRQLLLHETDVIFECRVCRALFRGLLNFVDHKKNYCTMRVGVENAIAAQSSSTGLQRWMCQDKEPIPVIQPEAPEEEDEDTQTNYKSKKKVPINSKPKQQLVLRKPDATYALVRPIPGTTKAMEQMVMRPEQVIYQSQLDVLSNFMKQSQDSDGETANLVGEMAIRQAENDVKKVQLNSNSEKRDGNKKRDTLHALLKNVSVSSKVVNVESNSQMSSKGKHDSSKQIMRVTLGHVGSIKKAICRVCKKECKNFTALAWHQRVHKNKLSFNCEVCLTPTWSIVALKRHLSTAHSVSPSKVDSMVQHRHKMLQIYLHWAGKRKKEKAEGDESSDEENDGESEPTCPICQKTFARPRNVKRHLEIHQREGLHAKVFVEEQEKDEDTSSLTPGGVPTCPICFKTFARTRNVKRHLEIHRRDGVNVESNKGNNISNGKLSPDQSAKKGVLAELQQQKQESKEDSSSEKEEDEEESSDDENEENNEETNASDAPALGAPACPVCDKTFASKRNVKRHLLMVHRRDGQNVTNKKLSSEQIAKNRVLQIMDEKTLRCRKCNKQLSGIRRLQQHCCNHFKLNRYRCTLCQYENSDYTQMRRHVMGKHGRHPQFRTIHLISQAIHKMKVGLWINLIVNNEVDDAHSTSTVHLKRANGKKNSDDNSEVESSSDDEENQNVSQKSESKLENSKNGVTALEKNDIAATNKGLATKVSMPLVMVERSSRLREFRENSRDQGDSVITLASPVSTNLMKPRVVVKKDSETSSVSSKSSEIVLRNSSSRSASPASARKPVADATTVPATSLKPRLMVKKEAETPTVSTKTTEIILRNSSSRSSSPASARKLDVPESPKRETPIRQARLNHRSVSMRAVQNLNFNGNGESAATPTISDTTEALFMMDKRQNRCIECNKRFQYLSSLRHHVQNHLIAKKSAQKTSNNSTKPISKPKASRKAGDIDSFINVSLLQCKKCNKRFTNIWVLKRHVGCHLGYTTFMCKYCDYISHSYTWFKKHLLLNHKKDVKNVESIGKLMATMKVKK